MLQIYMFTTVVFGVMSIAYGLGGKWWWQSLASASAADALSSGRKSDFAAILTSRVLGAAHLLVMGAPSGVAAGALAGTPVPYTPPAPRRCRRRPPHATAVANASASTSHPSDAPPADAAPPQRMALALLQLAEQLASAADAAASVALVPAAAPVPRSRAPAVVPTPTTTNATVALRSGGVRRGLIAGCARNVARQLAATVEGNLEGLGAVFDDHRIAVYEEGSSDGTAARLAAWARRNWRVHAFLRPPGTGVRTERLAACRNVLLDAAKGAWVHGGRGYRASAAGGTAAGAAATALSGTIFGAAHVGAEDEVPGAPADVRMDYLVMIDLDYTAPLPPPSLRHAVDVMASAAPPAGGRLAEAGGRLVAAGALEAAAGAAGARWGVLAGNSASDYYDLWALRSRTLGVDYDCWGPDALKKGTCEKHALRIDARGPPIEVSSAFNGVALYDVGVLRSGAAARCAYGSEPLVGTVNPAFCTHTCEHLAFHTCLRDAGVRLAILPSLVQSCNHNWQQRHLPSQNVVSVDGSGAVDRRDARGAAAGAAVAASSAALRAELAPRRRAPGARPRPPSRRRRSRRGRTR